MAKNNTRRKKDIKSKLIAAICMLLVSTIMMVSSTYAWFTLSTAPEVSGITTTIGSNGNLEIALSPASGLGADVLDADLQTGTSWLEKNKTWGNLLDMSDESYGLAGLTLAPAQLALAGDATAGYTLGTNVLGTPVYGSDGRISGLNANAFIAGKAADATGYGSVDADYGVRAVGTSSGMSAQALKQKTATSNIGNYATAAITAAANSLSADGAALAAMLVAHAQDTANDNNNYAQYIPALVKLTANLNSAVDKIDEALRASLAAAATTIADEAKFNAAITAIEGKTEGEYTNSLEDLVDQATTLGFTIPANFSTVLADRDAIASKIGTAVAAANGLMAEVDVTDEAGTGAPDGEVDLGADGKPVANVSWTDVSAVLNNLMKVADDSNIKISGQPISKIKQAVEDMDMDYLLGLATNCQIELGEGSGLYYDIALLTGNITAKVAEVPLSVSKGGLNLDTTLKNVIIKTTVPANTSKLPIMKTVASQITPAASEGGAMIDAFYGYVIDLMVRTNAADSKLLLQTVPAQRVYGDSANEATLGQGTTITFTTDSQVYSASLADLVKSINIVFFDPSHENAVFGMAKVESVAITEADTGEVDDAGDAIIEYTITGTFNLCSIVVSENGTGFYKAGEFLESKELCSLTQNIPQAISALVYLDGQDVTSADVLADQDVVGALNLQFASSADLKPMENSDLYNGTEPATP